MTLPISIIIPVYNEAGTIATTLEQLIPYPGKEILVVDGGSTDQTRDIVASFPVRLLSAPAGRGVQLHRGALAARGEILLFLHADTLLPGDWVTQVHETLASPRTAAGAFRLGIDSPEKGFRLIELGANLRSHLLQKPYGDQALFMLRETYFQAGGFPDWPLMEDVALVRHLRKIGRIRLARARVTTSARRWERLGLVRTTLRNQLIQAASLLGISPGRLARWYYS
ncbi:TIGR04283 family arsenosugar biosynthesis glycosyltransferase [Desulfolithobacter sp.]